MSDTPRTDAATKIGGGAYVANLARQLELELAKVREELKKPLVTIIPPQTIDDQVIALREELAKVKAERDEWKARTVWATSELEEELAKVKAERDAAVADAERYRWLRLTAWVDQLEYNSWYWGINLPANEHDELPEQFDAAIDAAKELK